MANLILSTVRRNISASEPSGFLYSVDLENQKILRRTSIVEPPYREWDNNPRGGLRDCRGITLSPDQIAIANASQIFRFNPQWTMLGVVSRHACSAIHNIFFKENNIWLTSARNDLRACLDFSGSLQEFIYLREHAKSMQGLEWRPPYLLNEQIITNGKIDFRDPRTNDDEKYDWAHVNSICFLQGGDKLISLGLVLDNKYAALLKIKKQLYQAGYWQAFPSVNIKVRDFIKIKKDMHSDLVVRPAFGKSAVVRISSQGKVTLCLALEHMTTPSHSLLPLKDGSVIYLNTTEGKIVHFDPHGKNQIKSITRVTNGFLRGVTILPDGNLILGSKGEILIYNLTDLKVLSSIRITSDRNESVYDINILPDQFSLLPLSLEEQKKVPL